MGGGENQRVTAHGALILKHQARAQRLVEGQEVLPSWPQARDLLRGLLHGISPFVLVIPTLIPRVPSA